jgi:hypothetical protein
MTLIATPTISILAKTATALEVVALTQLINNAVITPANLALLRVASQRVPAMSTAIPMPAHGAI